MMKMEAAYVFVSGITALVTITLIGMSGAEDAQIENGINKTVSSITSTTQQNVSGLDKPGWWLPLDAHRGNNTTNDDTLDIPGYISINFPISYWNSTNITDIFNIYDVEFLSTSTMGKMEMNTTDTPSFYTGAVNQSNIATPRPVTTTHTSS